MKKKEQQNPATVSSDPFEIENLRLLQNFSDSAAVRKVITSIPIRWPNSQEIFRVHPDQQMCFNTFILELEEGRENYLVDDSLWSELFSEFIPKTLFLRYGVLSPAFHASLIRTAKPRM